VAAEPELWAAVGALNTKVAVLESENKSLAASQERLDREMSTTRSAIVASALAVTVAVIGAAATVLLTVGGGHL